MKKIILIMTILFASFLQAKTNIVVSITPQKLFVQKIGGEKVAVKVMVKPGNSPHTYEPKPSQMKDIAKADIYFSIGVEFEEAWLPRFTNQNQKMAVFHIDKNIEKIDMAHKERKSHSEHEKGAKNPHIWVSPKNVEIIAHNIYDALIKVDSKNSSYYKKNLEKFLKEIIQIDKEITEILKNVKKDTRFMVFHPSWGYFAKEYELKEIAIEVGGKSPTPKNIIKIMKEAKEVGVKAIFVQPEFSDKIAKTLSNELQIPIIKISPLSGNWPENLIQLAKAIK